MRHRPTVRSPSHYGAQACSQPTSSWWRRRQQQQLTASVCVWFWCLCLDNPQTWWKLACRERLQRFWSRQRDAAQDEWALLWKLIGMNGARCSFSLLPVSFHLVQLWRIRFSSLISMINEARLLRRWRSQEAERERGGAYKSARCDEFTLVWRTQLIRSISLISLIFQIQHIQNGSGCGNAAHLVAASANASCFLMTAWRKVELG